MSKKTFSASEAVSLIKKAKKESFKKVSSSGNKPSGGGKSFLKMKENEQYDVVLIACQNEVVNGNDVVTVEMITEKGTVYSRSRKVSEAAAQADSLPCAARIITGDYQTSDSGYKYLEIDVYLIPGIGIEPSDEKEAEADDLPF